MFYFKQRIIVSFYFRNLIVDVLLETWIKKTVTLSVFQNLVLFNRETISLHIKFDLSQRNRLIELGC